MCSVFLSYAPYHWVCRHARENSAGRRRREPQEPRSSVKSVDKALTPVICRARTAVVGAGQATAHLGGGWMVRKEASLPVIGLMIVMIVFSSRTLVPAANRQQAGSAKQTAQRVMSLSAQAVQTFRNAPLVPHGEHCACPRAQFRHYDRRV